jgi:hypothetical protein
MRRLIKSLVGYETVKESPVIESTGYNIRHYPIDRERNNDAPI